jgi:prepilin signal peptidase PulO-like enzyme (type II secretory pathway)
MTAIHIFDCSIFFMLGASIASFLLVWATRLQKKKISILKPSRCHFCNKKLLPQQLIPVFSWLFQLGKCGCKERQLPILYLLVEIFLGVVFVIIFNLLPLVDALFFMVFASLLLFFLLTDYLHQLLHVYAMVFLMTIGLIYGFWIKKTFNENIIGAGVGFLMMLMINSIYKAIKKRDGFGGGDKYLMASIGAWVGPVKIIALLFLASWIGALVGIALVLRKRAHLMTALPMGVFIVLASPLLVFF